MLFDSKNFNGEVFAKYVEKTPNLNRNELIKSNAIKPRQDITGMFKDQTGGNYAVIPIYAKLQGNTQNYNGSTDIAATGQGTYTQGRTVIGRADAWVENDFSFDITGGVNFLNQAATQIAEYWDEVDQATILSILKGIFAMTGAKNLEFVNNHTFDVTGNGGNVTVGGVSIAANLFNATTLNNAMQKALGDNKAKFTMAFMHSAVATNLENLKLLAYMTYTDAQGIERQLSIATLNGRIVMIDDTMPTEEVAPTYATSTDTSVVAGKTYYTKSGSTYTQVSAPTGNPSTSSYYEMGTEGYTKYTSYVLGDGAIEYTDCGAKVGYEIYRDPAKNGGQDTMYGRQRKIFSPYGISFTNSGLISPTNEQLETGSNWSLANDNNATDSSKKYFPHKAIPIARVITRG